CLFILGFTLPTFLYDSGPLSGLEKLSNVEEKQYFRQILGDGIENDYFFNIPRRERGALFLGYHIESIKKITSFDDLNNSECKSLAVKLPIYEAVVQPKIIFGITWKNWKMCGQNSIYGL
ncbi:MAG: hypothetical protein H7196_04000, partial [candidate division SR1 bacterium]|nr:hypothetical protein [candidate division SR1 bacterium]